MASGLFGNPTGKNGNMIALEAANPAFETRLFRDDQVEIQGKLVGLIRTY